MHKISFVLLLLVQAIVCLWPFESTNELCTVAYKCNCSKERKVVDCSGLTITELTSKLLFSSAETVLLQNNKIRSLKKNFGQGESVKDIDLSHNTITFVASFAFSLFPNLVRLDLSHNSIWNLGTDLFGGLSSLQVLDLSVNNIQSFFDSVFKPTPQLRKLFMKLNPLLSLDGNKFRYLSQLEYLDLEYTGLISLDDDLFVSNTRLKYLSLASNGLNKVPSRSLRKSGRLLTLVLSDNPIAHIMEGDFDGLSNLTTLHLNRMEHLKSIKAFAFRGLINLRTLYCSNNHRLSAIDPLAFASNDTYPLKNIDVVYIRDNALATLSKKLLNWNTLYHLDLSGNPWNCDCKIEWISEMKWKHELQYNIRCVSPSKVAGKLVGALKRGDFTCQNRMSAQLIITLTLITTVAFSAVLVSIGVFLNRKGCCISCRSRIQTNYHQVSNVKDEEIDYEQKEEKGFKDERIVM